MAIDDGGLAFPTHPAARTRSGSMSLRDWFAGQALMGLLAGQWNVRPDSLAPQTLPASTDALAGNAYAMADAMLAQRKEGK